MQTFTPTFSAYRSRLGRVLPALAILIVLVYWRFDQPVSVFLIEWIVIVGASVGLTVLYFRNTRYTAAPRALTIRNTFGISHTVASHHLERAVLVERYVTSRTEGASSIPRLLILDDEGHSVLRWSGLAWSEAQMRELVATLEVELTVLSGRLGSGDIHRRYPRALGPWESNPILVAVVIILGLGVLTVTVLTGLGHA
ncbi:MAG TPA: hypothetical protein VGI56_12515 [Galbitalea sp.]|jgi:hypothetical protein